MQPPQIPTFTPPPPVYSLPPRSAGFPLWGKLLLGCGLALIVLFVLIGFGISRVLTGGRGMFQTQFCAQNLRTAQRGIELYSQDYDGTLPQAASWTDAVTPFVKGRSELFCPVVRVANPRGFGYAFNSKLSGAKTAKIETPLTTAVVYDSTNIERNATDAFATLPSPPRHVRPRGRGADKNSVPFNIILYADGHVRFVDPDGTSVDAGNSNLRRNLFSPRPKTK